MTDTTLSRTKLKLELARARRMTIAEEREEARRVEAERTAKLRAMRLSRDVADDVKPAKRGAKT